MKSKNRQIRILTIDDEVLNLKVLKKRIETTLSNIICDASSNGRDGIEMISRNNYDLIFMDIQMPGINGFETAQNIRIFNKETPIVAYSSIDYSSFLRESRKSNFNYYLKKPAHDGILFRTITKWIVGYRDNFNYLKPDGHEILSGKRIVVADDQAINRIMFKKNLERFGAKIVEASNGKELLKIYQESLAQNETKFDLIIADINMPPVNGDEATLEIRKIEIANHTDYHEHIPVIAVSADGQKEDIMNFFASKMDDYFIKGDDPNSLVKIAIIYLIKDLRKNKGFQSSQNTNPDSYNKQNCSLKTLNNNALSSYGKNDQREILLLFLDGSKRIMNNIRNLKKGDEPKLFQQQIHNLKGICNNIGADKLYQYTKEIDFKLKNGPAPQNENWIELLEKLYEELEQEIILSIPKLKSTDLLH